jgi:hypothetical protein
MDKPTRSPLTERARDDQPQELDRAAARGVVAQSRPVPPPPPPRPAPPAPQAASDGRFLGQAMKALFETADVSIKRGDETRVLSRAQDVLAELDERVAAHKGAVASEPVVEPAAPISSAPPRPRVDAVLWIVLAVGLFAIAGWMIAYAL